MFSRTSDSGHCGQAVHSFGRVLWSYRFGSRSYLMTGGVSHSQSLPSTRMPGLSSACPALSSGTASTESGTVLDRASLRTGCGERRLRPTRNRCRDLHAPFTAPRKYEWMPSARPSLQTLPQAHADQNPFKQFNKLSLCSLYVNWDLASVVY